VGAVRRQREIIILDPIWLGDLTILRAWKVWIYQATIVNGLSRRIMGWAFADHMRTDLIQNAMRFAIVLRHIRQGWFAY
jgi:putative transposase